MAFITVCNITVGLYRIQSLVLGVVSIPENILYALVEILNLAKKERNTHLNFFCCSGFSLICLKIYLYLRSCQPTQWKAGQEFYNQTSHLLDIFSFLSFKCEIIHFLFTFWFHCKNIQYNLTLKREKQENTE